MIKLISVGKIKENFYKEAIKEYEKRLSKYTKLNIIELEDEPNINGIPKEGEKILKKIKDLMQLLVKAILILLNISY